MRRRSCCRLRRGHVRRQPCFKLQTDATHHVRVRSPVRLRAGELMTESELRRAEPVHGLKHERKSPRIRDDDGNLIEK